jgi:hypothetical protein
MPNKGMPGLDEVLGAHRAGSPPHPGEALVRSTVVTQWWANPRDPWIYS